jgi:hypothetical protein
MCSLISHKKSLRATVNMENRVSYREKTQIRLPNYFYSKKTESFYISNGENYILLSDILMREVLYIEFKYEMKTMKFPILYEIMRWEDNRGLKCRLDILPENRFYIQNRELYLIGKCIELHLTGLYPISEYNLDSIYEISKTFRNGKTNIENLLVHDFHMETETDMESDIDTETDIETYENIRNEEKEE